MLLLTFYGPRFYPGALVIGIALLVLIAVICGYRKGASGIRYWTLAAAKVSIAFILWQILSFFMFPIIMIYTSGPGELRLFLIDLASLIIFIVLSFLLIFVEYRRSP